MSRAHALRPNTRLPLGVNLAEHEDGSLALRLATGSCDELVKVWRAQKPGPQGEVAWDPEPMAQGGKKHTAWVRDVAFCPFYGALQPCLATCSEDMKVVWRRPSQCWTPAGEACLDAEQLPSTPAGDACPEESYF